MKISTFFALLFIFGILMEAQAQLYYAVRSPDAPNPNIDLIDISNGTVVSSIPVSLTGTVIDGFTGMAFNQSDNELYTVVKSGSTFQLATLDPVNGVATLVTNLTHRFAGITFSPTGTLFGITGDGSAVASTIFEIDMTTGNTSLIATLDKAGNGEAIGYNTNDGLIYRYGGDGIFESIDPVSSNVTRLDTFNNLLTWSHSLVYNATSNSFIFTAGDTIYNYVPNTSLTTLSIDVTGEGYKGLVLQSMFTSINDPAGPSLLNIYPNPAKDVVKISLSNSVGKVTVRIMNVTGQIIATETFTGVNEISMPVNSLSKGVYFIETITDDETITKQFIKQ